MTSYTTMLVDVRARGRAEQGDKTPFPTLTLNTLH